MFGSSLHGLQDSRWGGGIFEHTIVLVCIGRKPPTDQLKALKGGPINEKDRISDEKTSPETQALIEEFSTVYKIPACLVDELPFDEYKKQRSPANITVICSDFVHPKIVQLAMRNPLSRAVYMHPKVDKRPIEVASYTLFKLRSKLLG